MHLLQKTLFYIHIKNTKNLLKKCPVKGVIIKPYMFRSLFHDHPQGSSFVLSAPTTYQPRASSFVFFEFVAVCPLFVCVSGVPVCVLSGRALHDQTVFVSYTLAFALQWRKKYGKTSVRVAPSGSS
jgi:hypothetical protein